MYRTYRTVQIEIANLVSKMHFDGGTKVIQLAKAKLGPEGLSTGQEDAEAGTLEEYATRQVFRVCASNLELDADLGHQHMGAVYHRGRIPSASTSESHGRT
ncbi:hypothetical protein BHE74_00032846 [Ensete ventricosum]|nr:hypothetical protein BHE74_00032846 [Ensete ventricosum]